MHFVIIFLLAAVFVLAAVQQLRNLDESRQQIRHFGLPEPLVNSSSLVLPILKFILALGLFVSITRLVAIIGITSYLLVSSVLIIFVVNQKHIFDFCGLAQLEAKPIGIHNLVRNGVLLVLTLVLWWVTINQINISIFSLSFILPAAVIGAALVIISQSWLIVKLSNQQDALSQRIDQLEQFLGLSEEELHEDETDNLLLALKPWQNQALLLLFWADTCEYCQALPGIAEQAQQQAHNSRYQTIVVSISQQASQLAHSSLPVVFDTERQIATHFGIEGVPAAILIDQQHHVLSPAALGAAAVQQLIHNSYLNSVSGPVLAD